MGIPLEGAWPILFYYALVILLFNIGGEELWCVATFFHGKNIPSDLLHGSSMASFGRPFTCSCSRPWRHTADVRIRTCTLFCGTANSEHLAWIIGHSFGNLPFLEPCARRIWLVNRSLAESRAAFTDVSVRR